MISQKFIKDKNPIPIFIKAKLIDFGEFVTISNLIENIKFNEIKGEFEKDNNEKIIKMKKTFYSLFHNNSEEKLDEWFGSNIWHFNFLINYLERYIYTKENIIEKLITHNQNEYFLSVDEKKKEKIGDINYYENKEAELFVKNYFRKEIKKEEQKDFFDHNLDLDIIIKNLESEFKILDEKRNSKVEEVEKYSKVKEKQDSFLFSEKEYNFIFKNWYKNLNIKFFEHKQDERIDIKEYEKLLENKNYYDEEKIPFKFYKNILFCDNEIFLGDEKNYFIYLKNKSEECDCCNCYDYENGVSLLKAEKYEGKLLKYTFILIPLFYYKDITLNPKFNFLLGLLD